MAMDITTVWWGNKDQVMCVMGQQPSSSPLYLAINVLLDGHHASEVNYANNTQNDIMIKSCDM
jgi:hypothetical protein